MPETADTEYMLKELTGGTSLTKVLPAGGYIMSMAVSQTQAAAIIK